MAANGKKERIASEIRAQIAGDIALGMSYREAAAKYHVSASTAHAIAGELGSRAGSILKSDELAVLASDYLREALTTLATQARHFRDSDWLAVQPAGTIYLVHGTLADKAFKLAAAFERTDNEPALEGDRLSGLPEPMALQES